MIDLATRMVIGWSLASHMSVDLVIDALNAAKASGIMQPKAIFHSDRGSVYTSKDFAKYAEETEVRLSVGRVATCYDNAVAESFFATFKKEMYSRYTFQPHTETRMRTMAYTEGRYNQRRLHSTLGYQTPYQALQAWQTHTAQAA